MNDRIEILILKSLVYTEEYSRKVLPFLKDEYFHEEDEKRLYQKISKFILEFNNLPSKEALAISVNQDITLSEDLVKRIGVLLTEEINQPDKIDLSWLVQETEKWCRDKAIFNAIKNSIGILDDKSGKKSKGAIPQMLSDALGISFDTNVGHDYVKNASDRYDNLHKREERLSFNLKMFDKITKGGIPKKTLNMLMGGIHSGKSLFLCHFASSFLCQGKNVLYITLEMSTEMVAQRIDANLLNISMDDLLVVGKKDFMSQMDKLVAKNQALNNCHLKIKEYPTASATVMNFKSLLDELLIKENFKPDVVIVDYLNLANSYRIGSNSNAGSYYVIKSVAEELRGLAVEYDICVWSATQLTRGGFVNTDPGMENTSESFGTPAVCDTYFAIITNEDLQKRGQIKVKQLKNRFGDISRNRKFLIGVDGPKMRLYDLDDSAQDEMNDEGKDDKPGFDKTKFGKGMNQGKKGFDNVDFNEPKDDDLF